MFRKSYITVILTAALMLVGSSAAFAQTAALRGRVEMKKEGVATPVSGVLVEVYRTDVKSKFPSDTTDKKGTFTFAGLPLGYVFAIAVSGPGISPEVISNIKAGMEGLVIEVREGDGRKLTEDEVRQFIAQRGTGGGGGGQETAEQKKAREDYEKQVKEITAKNEKAKQINETVNRALAEGGKAYEEKNYDLAIAKFQEGIEVDPTFAGTAPVLLNNKALSLVNRATETYNKTIKADEATKNAGRESAKKDFLEAVAATTQSLEILKAATAADANQQKNFDANKLLALSTRKNAYRLMSQTGVELTKGKEAHDAFNEYLAVETDPVKKAKAQLDLALTLQDSGEYERAVEEFGVLLETDPNNVDALVGMGLNLVNIGYLTLDTDKEKGKQQLQDASNYLQKFVDLAPDTHRFKDDARATIASLKEEQKVAPQKGKTPAPAKKKN